MARDYVAKQAHKRDEAIVTFLTQKSPLKKTTAVFNAAMADMALANTRKLKGCFNALSARPLERGARASAQFVHKLYKRSKSITTWRAGLQIVRKAFSHSRWEKYHENKGLEKYSKVFNKVAKGQIEVEQRHAKQLSMSDAYSSRLDRFTPGLRGQTVMGWINEIGQIKPKIIKKAKKRAALNDEMKSKNLPDIPQETGQRIIMRIYKDFGITAQNADIHFASHPMCFEGEKRTKILLCKEYDNFFSAVMDAVHEAGHALYRINMSDEVRKSMMGLIETDYAGMDEAMAMLFDQNLVQTPQFAEYLMKVIKGEAAHEIASYYDAKTIYKGLNAAPFGLTRVKAGPEQYALFMAQYGELERDLMLQRIAPEELPEEWHALANDWHGITPQEGNTKESVFQDPHWSLGEIGRFSGGYLPGSLMAAQIYDALIAGQPQIMNAVQNGNFAPFIQLCREKLYYQPRRAHYNDFMKSATGQELKAASFLNKAKDDIDYIWQSTKPKATPSFKPNS